MFIEKKLKKNICESNEKNIYKTLETVIKKYKICKRKKNDKS